MLDYCHFPKYRVLWFSHFVLFSFPLGLLVSWKSMLAKVFGVLKLILSIWNWIQPSFFPLSATGKIYLIFQKRQEIISCGKGPHKKLGLKGKANLRASNFVLNSKQKAVPSFNLLCNLIKKSSRKAEKPLSQGKSMKILWRKQRLWISLKGPQGWVLEIVQYKHSCRWPGLCSLERNPVCYTMVTRLHHSAGCVLLCVDSWESFPHFDSKRSWTLPFHFWKVISVRRLLACLPSGLGASQTTPTFLGPPPLCFSTSPALRWPDIKSCQSGCQNFKGLSQVYTKAHLFSSWMEIPVASRHREPKVSILLTFCLYHLADEGAFISFHSLSKGWLNKNTISVL